MFESSNMQGQRFKFERARLVRDLQRFGVNVCCMQETHLIVSGHENTVS